MVVRLLRSGLGLLGGDGSLSVVRRKIGYRGRGWKRADQTRRKCNKKRDAPEAVLEPPRDGLEVAHPAGTSGLSALGLLSPLVRAELGRGVAALRASCDRQPSASFLPSRLTIYTLLCCLWKARLPQRLQSVWVLVWRLPKDEVPIPSQKLSVFSSY